MFVRSLSEETVGSLERDWLRPRIFDALEGCFFHREVCLDVEVGCSRVLVAEPECDDGDVYSRLEQLHRGRVSQGVGRDPFSGECSDAFLSATRKRCSTPERDSRLPARLGNTGASGPRSMRGSHERRFAAVLFQRGTTRSLRPFPWRHRADARSRRTSATRRPMISETRAPVCRPCGRTTEPTDRGDVLNGEPYLYQAIF